MYRYFLLTLVVLILAGCVPPARANPSGEVDRTPSETELAAVAAAVATLQAGTAAALPTLPTIPDTPPAPTQAPTVAYTPTPDPYDGLTIDSLAARSYGGGELSIQQEVGDVGPFSRYLIAYPSDGLQIHGFLNIPDGEGPFPVIIALHGYVDPARYYTLDYTTPYADSLASAGYLVIHPNLRGYAPSDDGPNAFRSGFAIDVLNLIEIVKMQAGSPGPLAKADPNRIGMWGHSMGGGVTLRVITLSPDIKAAVVYGSMSGDERQNYERIYNVFSNRERGLEELNTPEEDLQRISAASYYDRIQAAVSIHHGEMDEEVPPEWSEELCSQLQSLGKQVECFSYAGQPHTFSGDGDFLFLQRTIDFYNRALPAEFP